MNVVKRVAVYLTLGVALSAGTWLAAEPASYAYYEWRGYEITLDWEEQLRRDSEHWEPPTEYGDWYVEVSRCTGLRADPRPLEWFVADSISRYAIGVFVAPNQIFLERSVAGDRLTVEHEMLHYLIEANRDSLARTPDWVPNEHDWIGFERCGLDYVGQGFQERREVFALDRGDRRLEVQAFRIPPPGPTWGYVRFRASDGRRTLIRKSSFTDLIDICCELPAAGTRTYLDGYLLAYPPPAYLERVESGFRLSIDPDGAEIGISFLLTTEEAERLLAQLEGAIAWWSEGRAGDAAE